MKTTRQLTTAAMLIAVMMALSYIEARFPVSTVPGIKLGLANCSLLAALYWLDFKTAALIMTVRVVLSGLLFSGPMTIPYGLAGGLCSLLVMRLLKNIPGVSPVGQGIGGGAAHNLAQVITAVILLGTPALFYQLALLLPVGGLMGAATGTVTAIILRHVRQDSPPE